MSSNTNCKCGNKMADITNSSFQSTVPGTQKRPLADPAADRPSTRIRYVKYTARGQYHDVDPLDVPAAYHPTQEQLDAHNAKRDTVPDCLVVCLNCDPGAPAIAPASVPAHWPMSQSGHDSSRPYACDYCPSAFSSSQSLSRHKHTHTRKMAVPTVSQVQRGRANKHAAAIATRMQLLAHSPSNSPSYSPSYSQSASSSAESADVDAFGTQVALVAEVAPITNDLSSNATGDGSDTHHAASLHTASGSVQGGDGGFPGRSDGMPESPLSPAQEFDFGNLKSLFDIDTQQDGYAMDVQFHTLFFPDESDMSDPLNCGDETDTQLESTALGFLNFPSDAESNE